MVRDRTDDFGGGRSGVCLSIGLTLTSCSWKFPESTDGGGANSWKFPQIMRRTASNEKQPEIRIICYSWNVAKEEKLKLMGGGGIVIWLKVREWVKYRNQQALLFLYVVRACMPNTFVSFNSLEACRLFHSYINAIIVAAFRTLSCPLLLFFHCHNEVNN